MIQRANVVVSTYADNLLRDAQPDVKFYIFNSLEELSKYVDQKPIRAQRLYMSKDVLMPAAPSALTFLMELLKNPFLAVDQITYLTEEDSEEIATVKYLIGEYGFKNWTISVGSLNREFITNFIAGTVRDEDVTLTRKAVYRVPKSEYIKEQIKNSEELDEEYESDEDALSGIPDETPTEPIAVGVEHVCQNVNITGLPTMERTLFSFIMAQYLSFNGKTVIIEHDFEFLTLTDMASKTEIPYLSADMKELLENTREVLREIRNYSGTLIIITCHDKSEYDFSFVSNIIYNNLINDIDYLVLEQDFSELASTAKYVIVMPNNTCDVLRTCGVIPDNYEHNCKFVAINDRTIDELSIRGVDALREVIEELLSARGHLELQILNFSSLTIGGEAHDLRMFVE